MEKEASFGTEFGKEIELFTITTRSLKFRLFYNTW